MNPFFNKISSKTTAFLERPIRLNWLDFILFFALAGMFFGVIHLAEEWGGVHRPTVEINLSFRALPLYAFYSLCRGLIAYLLSLSFTLVYGYWAAKDKIAEKVLVPLLDILQSVPVLGFMPSFVLALVTLFPNSNIGLELSAILMIFTGQVWNMTFSYYYSIRSIPNDLLAASRIYHFNWWQKLKNLELPYSTLGLVWNSMMSMAGGWFFLMISESFVLGKQDFRLPGLGSYMSVAVQSGNIPAMLLAILSMILLIIFLDQILWRPVVVWAQKFRIEEGSNPDKMSSWFLDWIYDRKINLIFRKIKSACFKKISFKRNKKILEESHKPTLKASRYLSYLAFIFLIILLSTGMLKILHLLTQVKMKDWFSIFSASLLTLMRVLLSTLLGTLWALPAGIAIGLSPRLSRIFQPIIQVVASFPAPMLFPLLIALLQLIGIPLFYGSIFLMLMGTQWYILFNVIAGAMAIPNDLKEASLTYHLSLKQRFFKVYAPSVFPYLVTGWVAAAGGAWNASIVSEYLFFKGKTLSTWGIGAQINEAAQMANYQKLAAAVLVMSFIVVTFNRLIWKPLYTLAESKFSSAI